MGTMDTVCHGAVSEHVGIMMTSRPPVGGTAGKHSEGYSIP